MNRMGWDDDRDTELDLDGDEREELPDERRPLPGIVSVAICFVPDGLQGREWEEAVKREIRKVLRPLPPDWMEPGLWKSYRPNVWPLIREVLAEG
jgi:hypothetical protein